MSALRTITTGLRFPEGPIAMPDGCVIVVEIAGECLTRIAPDGTKTRIADIAGGPNGAAIGPDGACYVCNNGGFEWLDDPDHGLRPKGPSNEYIGGSIEKVDLETGTVTRLYNGVEDQRLSAPNDIVFDRNGGFWFTDMGKTFRSHADHGALYYAAADGSAIKRVAAPVATANGIALSADETRLYVAETAGARIWEFALSAPGEIARLPFPSPHGGRMLFVSPRFQRFDSLALDAAGNICVAAVLDGMILVISPQGQELAAIPMPDMFPTNICFGGPEMRTAFVTLSGHGRLAAMQWPRPGLPLNYLNK